MDLYIAEKPSVAAAIADVLPGAAARKEGHIVVGETVVTWCRGHLLEQGQPEDYDPSYAKWDAATLPILPSKWILKPRDGSAAQLKVIAGLIKKATRVINAGDADAEGQLLVDEVLEHYGNRSPVMRILVTALEPQDVRKALAAIESNTKPRYVGWREWARCRSRLDWLIGMNMSRAYTLRARETGDFRGVLTVGRVQTPTLALIVGRDEAIENFRAVPFYTLQASLTHSGVSFAANWRPSDKQQGLDPDGRLLDASVAQQLVARTNGKTANVVKFKAEGKKSAPPMPHDLSSLQMACNDEYGYSAAQVDAAAQALYEKHKVTTYPRTDKRYLANTHHETSAARFAAIRAICDELSAAIKGANPALKTSAFNDAQATPHHGIIPTTLCISPSVLSEVERNVFSQIARGYLAQFYPAYEYDETTVDFDIAGESFRASGKLPRVPGWKVLFTEPAADDDADGADEEVTAKQRIPAMRQGETLSGARVEALSRKTTPPKRFNEKLLIAAMCNIHQYVELPAAKARLKEGDGIGTTATRSSIIEELKKRQLILVKGKQLISTPAGRALIHALPKVLTDAGFTGMTEQSLDLVAEGKLAPNVFMEKSAALITTLTAQAASAKVTMPEEPSFPCPVCRKGKLRRVKLSKGGFFWPCSEFKTTGCKAAYDDNRGKPQLTPKRASSKRASTTKRATTKRTSTKGKRSKDA